MRSRSLPLRSALSGTLLLLVLVPPAGAWPGLEEPAVRIEPAEPGPPAEPALPDEGAGLLGQVRDPALYRGEVELLSQGAGERRAAAARALAQVVVKLSGDPQAPAHPVVRRALAQAESFVIGAGEAESSDSQGNTAIGGVPVYRARMSFDFDPGRVEALLAGAGLPYWGPDRPQPLLWLAIDDGRGPRLVSAQQINVVKPLANRGLERGLRFALPAGSAVELAAVDAVWSLSAERLQPLAARYGNRTLLLGRLYRGGNGWTADWLLAGGERELSRWSFSDASAMLAIASGADGAADAIARRDAVALDTGEPESLEIELAGLRGSGDLGRALGYLQTLPVVRGLEVLEARPEALRLRLDLAVGAESFRRFVATGGTLAADPFASEDVPRFLLQP
ncbi:DUF2066 domain-containing protein [Arenimonas fontis]|nr:DUF2066 domain-containing protein [Arenimonas fontis]